MKYRFHILLKYSSFSINNHKYSFNVTFDSSRRHKMFSSLSNVCDEMKKITFLTEIYHLLRSVNPYETIDITDPCSMQDMCKIWT